MRGAWLLGGRPSAVRTAAMRLRTSLAELPMAAVGLDPSDWGVETTGVRMAVGEFLHALRALRTNGEFRLLLARVDEAAAEVDAAIEEVRAHSLPWLLEQIGTLVNPAVAARARNAAASRFHLPVDQVDDGLDRLVRALDALGHATARPGGEAGS